MNQDQLGGIVRAIVPPLVTWLVAKNIIPGGAAVVWPYRDTSGTTQIRCFMPGAGT